jgi:AcrR family transcriptional regulator
MTSKTSKTYHHGELRENLIEAAITLINEKGISDLSLRQLARYVGVSHNAPYRHFETKQALLIAVAEEGFIALRKRLEEAKIGSSEDARDQLRAIGIAYVQFALTHPAHYQVMFGDYRNHCCESASLAEVSKQAFGVLVNIIQEGQDQGIFREGNTINLARVAWSLVHGQAMLKLDHRLQIESETEFNAFLSFSTEMLIEGIKQ